MFCGGGGTSDDGRAGFVFLVEVGCAGRFGGRGRGVYVLEWGLRANVDLGVAEMSVLEEQGGPCGGGTLKSDVCTLAICENQSLF
jgi:hypothetical protein